MKVFFIGERRYDENIKMNKRIISLLEKQNFKVDKSLIQTSHEEDNTNFEKAYKRNLQSIKGCDFVVAEVSSKSSGLGFLLATAISNKKPVIALYNAKSDIKESVTLKGVSSTQYIPFKYDETTLDKILVKAISQVKQKLDTKFILIISPEIDRYLEWSSDYKRMHKAQIVREAVEDMMKKDKEWKEIQD